MPWAESVPFVSSGLPAGHLQGLLGPQAMATGYLGPSRNEPHGCGRQTAHLCLQTRIVTHLTDAPCPGPRAPLAPAEACRESSPHVPALKS